MCKCSGNSNPNNAGFLTREYNFSKTQSRVTGIIATIFVTSLLLTIFADYVPHPLAVTGNVLISLSGTFLIFWMIYCCTSANTKAEMGKYEPGYKAALVNSGPSSQMGAGNAPRNPSGTTTRSYAHRDNRPAANRQGGGFKPFTGKGNQLGGT